MKPLLAVLSVFLLLYYPEIAVNAARQAMHTWYNAVAPSLFPFLALMPALTSPQATHAWQRLLGPILRRIFDLPGETAPAVAIGMLSGSPAGVHAAARCCKTTGQLQRIACCACGMSPAFLITGVGAAIRGNPADGHILLRAQIFAQIMMLLLTRRMPQGDSLHNIEEKQSEAPVRAAVGTVLTVCGYMILFTVAAEIIRAALKNELAGRITLCILDAPSAAKVLAQDNLPLTAAAVGFGGLCIAAQNLSAGRKYGLQPTIYLCAKAAQAALMTAATDLQQRFLRPGQTNPLPILEFSILAATIFILPILKNPEKDLFLNKRNFDISAEKRKKIQEKPQYVVVDSD